MPQFWTRFRESLKLNFESSLHGRDLQATFELLGNVIKFLVALTAIWALAAGFLQTARLIEHIPAGFPGQATGFWAEHSGWLGPLLGVPVYTLKAFSVTMLLGLAAAMVGGILGFLFGVPRPAAASGNIPPPSAVGSVPVQPAASGVAGQPSNQQMLAGVASGPQPTIPTSGTQVLRSGRVWQSSTNLTEISDWLTKIIVGVGLVEAKALFASANRLSQSLSLMLFDGAVGSRLVIPAVVITGALVGFLYAHLFTQLVVATLFARTDVQLGASIPETAYQAIVPRATQTRKESFSDYVQSLVTANDSQTLDKIAQALGVGIGADLQSKRGAILTTVASRVNLPDAAKAEKAMDDLSQLLQTITNRTF